MKIAVIGNMNEREMYTKRDSSSVVDSFYVPCTHESNAEMAHDALCPS